MGMDFMDLYIVGMDLMDLYLVGMDLYPVGMDLEIVVH